MPFGRRRRRTGRPTNPCARIRNPNARARCEQMQQSGTEREVDPARPDPETGPLTDRTDPRGGGLRQRSRRRGRY